MENNILGDAYKIFESEKNLNLSGNILFLNKITYPETLQNDKTQNLITFDDLLEPKKELEKAILTSYIWDSKFIAEHFPSQVAITLACHWEHPKKAGKKRSIICSEHGMGNCKCSGGTKREIEIVHPPFPEDIDGNVHSKLMILCFPSHLRVVISSANLQERDWDAVGQIIWFQDFLRKDSKLISDLKKTRPINLEFGHILGNFLSSLPVDPSLFLDNYDLSTATPHLISSVPGVYVGESAKKYGHIRLRELVAKAGWPNTQTQPEVERESNLDYQTASIGAIRPEWLSEFLYSTVGKDKRNTSESLDRVNFRVLFPTHLTVAVAKYVQGARTICYWDKLGLTKKKLYHIANPDRPGVLTQSKVLIRSLPDSNFGWVYAGSHNLSSSAWGRLAEGNLQINNYELGILFIPPMNNLQPSPENSLERFSLPFLMNSPKYSPMDRPWVIPKKSRFPLHAKSVIKLQMYVLPEKMIFVPKAEELKAMTGVDLVKPPQPCINFSKYGFCKYGEKCKYSHAYAPLEVTGKAEAVFEATRVIMEAVSKNSFSIGVSISLNEETFVNGWFWKIVGQPRYTAFIPDNNSQFANDTNLEVYVIASHSKDKLMQQLSDLSFLCGGGIWFGVNTQDSNRCLYVFGNKTTLKLAEQDINIFLNKDVKVPVTESNGNHQDSVHEEKPKE